MASVVSADHFNIENIQQIKSRNLYWMSTCTCFKKKKFPRPLEINVNVIENDVEDLATI